MAALARSTAANLHRPGRGGDGRTYFVHWTETMKLLLDTDIGSDIDDAVCLAYLLANDRCELLGITTVTGEPQKRACLASALCAVAGKHVPICSGSPLPLLIPQRQTEAPQAAA